MIYLLLFISFCVAITLSYIVIPHILLIAFRKKLFDIPDERKDHVGAVPRLGGISFFPVLTFCFFLFEGLLCLFGKNVIQITDNIALFNQMCFFFCGLILLYLVGIADDLVGVRYRQKFIVQIFVAALFPISGLWINNFYGLFGFHEISPLFGMPLTVFLVVFITNAINLIDGIDGLASGLSSVASAVFGVLYLNRGVYPHAAIAFLMLGILLPFFYFNVFGQAERCRKIFMGDTGSLTIGLVLSFLSINYAMYNPEIISQFESGIIVAFATLIIPAFDVVRVVLYRMRKHKPLFLPDRSHIHHKFLAMGFTHRQTMILILLMSALFSGLNIWAVSYININIIFITDVLIWTGLNLWFDRIKDHHQLEMNKS